MNNGQGPVILVVEDDRMCRELIAHLADRMHYDVIMVQTIRAARRSIDGADVVVLDVMLPDGNGLDFLDEIRRCGVMKPVVIHSGSASMRARDHAENGDLVQYVEKGDVEGFRLSLAKAVAASAGMEEIFRNTTRLRGCVGKRLEA